MSEMEKLVEVMQRNREAEAERSRRADERLEIVMEKLIAEKHGGRLDKSIVRLREASMELHDGRHVYYDDGPMGRATLQDAADLSAVLAENHTTGSPNLENMQARHILDRLQTGQGLGQVHLGTLVSLLRKHRGQVEQYRATRNRDGQDPMVVASDGAGAGITKAGDLPARTQEAALAEDDWAVDSASRYIEKTEDRALRGTLKELVRLREEASRPRAGDDLLAAIGLGETAPDSGTTETSKDAQPVREGRAGLSIRDAMLYGNLSITEALGLDGGAALRRFQEAHGGGDLMAALGFDQGGKK